MISKNKKIVQDNRVVVTSALPYVNNIPHLGNIIGCVLSADVYARFLKIVKKDVLFVGGVDEYGTASEMKAMELGITCKELCDMNYIKHKEAYDWFRINFDCYGRTSQPDGTPEKADLTWPHTFITHDIYKKLVDSGFVIEQEEKVFYCEEIKSFVADRYIIGTCPYCKSEKADGDQCDSCGNLLSTDKIINPKYKPNPSYEVTVVLTKNLFLNLPEIWKKYDMDKWFDKNKKTWSDSAQTITEDWLKKGIKPRSITRDLKWGTKVPYTNIFKDDYSSKVFYVWFDAPIGYLSIIENSLGKSKALEWWNKNTQLVQFMAKDNVPFHSIVFPSTLAPINQGYELPENITIASTEYLLFEGNKFSKSKNTGLFCDDVMRISEDLDLDPDLWRAYLIYIRPESNDSNFVMNGEGFVDFINFILINNIGNLVHRVKSIMYQYYTKHNVNGKVKYYHCPDMKHDKIIKEFIKNTDRLSDIYAKYMSDFRFSLALKTVLNQSSECNNFINKIEPWKYIKMRTEDIPEIFFEFLCHIFTEIRYIGQNLEPIMPNIGKKIRTDFEYDYLDGSDIKFGKTKPEPMFKILEEIDLEKYKK